MLQTFMELSSWLLGPLGWIAVGWFLAGVLVASSNAICCWLCGADLPPVMRANGEPWVEVEGRWAHQRCWERSEGVVVEFPSPGV